MKNRRIDVQDSTGTLFILVLILAIDLLLALCIMAPTGIGKAMKSPVILQVERQLRMKGPVEVKVGNWYEEKAVENIVRQYNEEYNNDEANTAYKVYRLGNNHFWLTNDKLQEAEISYMTAKYFDYLNDMIRGQKKDEAKFNFECTNNEQKMKMEQIINESVPVQEALNIKVDSVEKGEITFVTLTVGPKETLGGGT